jgi:hypothetical protein
MRIIAFVASAAGKTIVNVPAPLTVWSEPKAWLETALLLFDEL